MHHLGLTRSASRREYLLHTPDSFVSTPLPGLSCGVAIVHTGPPLGAAFVMTTVIFEPDGVLDTGPGQRFVYVLDGEVALTESGSRRSRRLEPGGFAFLPALYPHRLTAGEKASRLVMFEKPYAPLAGEPVPELIVGHEAEIIPAPLNGDAGVQVRALLPSSMDFDFAVNTMTYEPGASLGQVEVHWMEHGLLMLSGGGVYRLGEEWYPVETGDAIWMAPFCPQWFAAVGKLRARYLIYKDFNRHVLA